jgi:hypothetical protein
MPTTTLNPASAGGRDGGRARQGEQVVHAEVGVNGAGRSGSGEQLRGGRTHGPDQSTNNAVRRSSLWSVAASAKARLVATWTTKSSSQANSASPADSASSRAAPSSQGAVTSSAYTPNDQVTPGRAMPVERRVADPRPARPRRPMARQAPARAIPGRSISVDPYLTHRSDDHAGGRFRSGAQTMAISTQLDCASALRVDFRHTAVFTAVSCKTTQMEAGRVTGGSTAVSGGRQPRLQSSPRRPTAVRRG